MTKTENIQNSFEESISVEKPFMVFRIPGRGVELADFNGQTLFLLKPWKGEIFSFESSSSGEKPSLPQETSKADYAKSFKKYKEAFLSGGLQKAILSSVIREDKPQNFDPIGFFFRLCETYPSAFTYLLYHPKRGTWCGATPEVLLEGKREQFATVALAGTQSVVPSQNYEWGEKEKEEQELVSQHVRAILENVGVKELKESEPYTIQAADVVHLKTDFRFKHNGKVESLLNQLHPTPAVAGLPVSRAIELIDSIEKHDRSLYTGYFGILTENETHVFVNLRCMQIGNQELALYVGGGITERSEMEAEWEETRLKAKTLLNLLKS